MERLPHVVVIGAGFGGLAAAAAMGGRRVRVTVVDRRNHHLFVPLLYQVATAALSPADIAQPVRRMLRRHRNVEVVLGEAVGIDPARRTVRVDPLGDVAYDRLVVATGSTHGYFGHDEWARHAPGLKTIEDARVLRTRLLLSFERAEIATDPAERDRLLTMVVVGGGPTGVEMAGSIAELARKALARDFRRIDPAAARVVLVEAGPRLLAGFPPDLSDYALRTLRAKGVEVRLGTPVEDVGAYGVTAEGGRIPAATIVWGAGVKASPAGSWLRAETDEAGRVRVRPDLSVPGAEGAYAIGDVALAEGDGGEPLPGLAQVAKQQGRHLGRAIADELEGGPPVPPFRYRDRGNTAIIGRNAAVFDFGSRRLTGWPAWILWAVVHVWLLSGFQNRMLVSMQWLWRYLTYQRGARLISDAVPADDPSAVSAANTSAAREAPREAAAGR